MTYNLVIEIGGVNTSIYRRNQGLVLKEPSLICASSFGQQYEIKAIGNDAEKLQGKTNDHTYIFSPVVCGEVKSVEYAAEMLKYFLNKVALRHFPKENVIFLIPVGVKEEVKQDFKKIAKLSGLGKIAFIPNVVCVANAAQQLSNQISKTVLITHFGGTLSDVAAINTDVILKGASIELGGRHLDIEIAQYISKKHKVEISIASAKRIKEKVATLIEGDVRSMEVIGIDDSSGKPKQIVVSSEEIFPILSSFMENIITAIETTINICPPEVSGDVAKNGLYISGGLCEIGGISKFLSKKLGLKVNLIEDASNAAINACGKLLNNKKVLHEIIENS